MGDEMGKRRLRRAGGAVLAMVGAVGVATTMRADAVDPNPGVNDQPDVTITSPVSTTPGAPVALTVTVSDPDEHLLDMELEIDISDLDGAGGRSVAAGDYGTFTWGGGAGLTTDLELQPLADQNADLATLTYTPPVGFAGTARVIFEIDDQGNTGTGGELSRTRFVDITVAAVGDATAAVNSQPDVTLPADVVTAIDTPVSFAPTVSDPDVGPFDMELEIDISDLDGVGGLSVPAGDYGTFTWGGGSGLTSDVELQPLADQNADLATFTYTPAAGFSGTARVIFEIDDQGNSGSEFPPNELSRTRFIDIEVVEPADLELTATVPTEVDAGTNLTYTLTLTNDGTADSADVTIATVVPTGTTFVSLVQTDGVGATLVTPAVGATGPMSMFLATLADGATVSFDVTVAVPLDAADGAIVTVTATATAETPDPVTTDNSVTATATVQAAQATTTTASTVPSDTSTTSPSTTASVPTTATTAPAVGGEALPRTGSSGGSSPMVGALLVLGGLALVAAARRSRRWAA
jgi:uncharacterized repeat protein (TIGR01451 family)/LPXTG-motif cell wall-anchored protein